MRASFRPPTPRLLATAAVLTVALLGPAISMAHRAATPAAVLDQNNPSRDSVCRYTMWTPDRPGDWAAQTFTAGETGRLTEVVVWLKVATAPPAVSIAPVGPAGAPVPNAPLATATPNVGATSGWLLVPVGFSAPARVEAGTQYSLVLASAQNDWAWKLDLGSSFVDATGARCASGAYAAGRAWPVAEDADFFFQTYVVPTRRLTVRPLGTGSGTIHESTGAIDCGETCAGEFPRGQTLTLTATPARNSTFSGWSGAGCEPAGTDCTLTVADDMAVNATFTRLLPVSLQRTGHGTVKSRPPGIACGLRCSYAFTPGRVTLAATPARGWRFARWQGACQGTTPSCRLNLQHAVNVRAIFVTAH